MVCRLSEDKESAVLIREANAIMPLTKLLHSPDKAVYFYAATTLLRITAYKRIVLTDDELL